MAQSGNQDVPTITSDNPFADTVLSNRLRIESFVFDQTERYIVVFWKFKFFVLKVYSGTRNENGIVSLTNVHPYLAKEIFEMDIVQAADSMIIVHPDHPPARIFRKSEVEFLYEELNLKPPNHEFNDSLSPVIDPLAPTEVFVDRTWVVTFAGAQIAPGNFTAILFFVGDGLAGGTTGEFTYDVTTPVNNIALIHDGFVANSFVGTDAAGDPNPRYLTGDVVVKQVDDVASSHTYTIQIKKASTLWNLGGFTDDDKTSIIVNPAVIDTELTLDQGEPAWSEVRGFPASVCFHDGRMWFGATPSLPTTLFASTLRNIFDFSTFHEEIDTVRDNAGVVVETRTVRSVEDDDGIKARIDSDQMNRIVQIISNRDLQLFTTGGEGIVTPSGQAITPDNIGVQFQTSHGTYGPRPVPWDGGTLFADKSGNSIRRFVFTEDEESYIAPEVNPFAKDLVRIPQQLSVSNGFETSAGFVQDKNTYLFVVNADGTLAVCGMARGDVNEKVIMRQTWMGPWNAEHRDRAQGKKNLHFDVGRAEIFANDKMYGYSSRATCDVSEVVLQTGDWGSTVPIAEGRMVVDDIVGFFANNEIVGDREEALLNGDFQTSDLTNWLDISVGTGTASAATGELILTSTDNSNYGSIRQVFAITNNTVSPDRRYSVIVGQGSVILQAIEVRVLDNSTGFTLLDWTGISSGATGDSRSRQFDVPDSTTFMRLELRNAFTDHGTAHNDNIVILAGHATVNGPLQDTNPNNDQFRGRFTSVAAAGSTVFTGTLRTLGIKEQFAPVGTPTTSLFRTQRFVEEFDFDIALDCAVGAPSIQSTDPTNPGPGTLFDYAAGRLGFKTWGHLDGESSAKACQLVSTTGVDALGFENDQIESGYVATFLEAGIGTTGAGFALIGEPLNFAVFGLNFFPRLETLPLIPPPNATIEWEVQYRLRRVSRFTADFTKLGGCFVNNNKIAVREAGETDEPLPGGGFVPSDWFAELKTLPDRGFERDKTLVFEQFLPVPMEIRAIDVEIEVDKMP